ncbi:MAG: hypothetical protein ABWZ79_11240 [Pedobacter agri]|uniref:hypothetical protein n=1 Tax=Pedobacter agri TaxID=454586 RepID=UPI000E2481C8|nr:hypothetical protein [Pedobacter agri]MDQ1141744.1 hypothetical protein [Pedobacter agri]RZJ63943.1 MAG: hypothetical protein EOO47_27635 [Flavobacterium sp.]
MKRIFLALLLCASVAFNAAANNHTPKSRTALINEAITQSISIGDKQSSNQVNLVRQEMVYRFTDACGVRVYIHVFASDGTPVRDMHLAAMQHFQNGTWTSDGCYQNH